MVNFFDINLFDNSDFSSSDYGNKIGIIRVKRYIRDAINPFTAYLEHEFHIRYRFSKNHVMYGLLPLVKNSFKKPDMRGLSIEPIILLLICLRFYATGNFQVIFYITFLIIKEKNTNILNILLYVFK